jgi:AcrR family transcriptional regulator
MVEAVGERGFAPTTVADAVRRARVSRGTFYAEFPSKEACFAAGLRQGCDALEERVARAVRAAADWREELRFGTRAWAGALHETESFARAYLLEAHNVPDERVECLRRFGVRCGRSAARSGRPVPADDALLLLAAGAHETAAAALRAGRDLRELEEVLTACAIAVIVSG